MGKLDTLTKEYMSDSSRFTDAFNYYFFDGKKVINSSNLKEMDPTEIAAIFGNKSKEIVQKFRDILKSAILMEDDKCSYLILGIENQTKIHYAMPVKTMIYDALNYCGQVSEITKMHRKMKDFKSSAEFLSGFKKTDKIKPVVTLTIYWGDEEWDAPRSLKEMFDDSEDERSKLVNNYELNLIVPKEIKDFSKFSSSFGTAMRYISASTDEELFQEVATDEKYRMLDSQTVDLLNICMGLNLEIEGGQEVFDMCEALKQRDSKKINEGIKQGIEQGKEIGFKEGKEIGFEEGIFDTISRMLKKEKSIQEIVDFTGFEEAKVQEVANALDNR